MNRRFVVLEGELAGGKVGLALICGAALVQRHAEACVPGFWSIRHYELANHRTAPTGQAVIDDFGTLCEVVQ